MTDYAYVLDKLGYKEWSVGETYDSLTWKNTEVPQPSKEFLDEQYIILKATLGYKDQRIYPSIDDQLDMMYHDKINGTSTWVDAITAVKQKWPKPKV